MSTSTAANPAVRIPLETRVLREGYGPGAWHGADLKAALADVTPEVAFWRPSTGRHNIAEIALHHAYCTRAVRAQVSGQGVEPFVLNGEDWFEAADESTLAWPIVQATVESEQRKLGEVLGDIEAGRVSSPLSDAERFDLVLGITCHAVYHAGQVQLIKRLRGE
jgi:DinB superfamily